MATDLRTTALAALLLCSACTTFDAQAPRGFAVYDDGADYRAVSPEGVVFRVRSEDNEPRADLAFWREALGKRMNDAGYVTLAEHPVKAHDTDGHLLELAAPLGNRDYAYAVAIFVADDDIVLVEAAGDVTQFKAQREAIIAAIGELRVLK